MREQRSPTVTPEDPERHRQGMTSPSRKAQRVRAGQEPPTQLPRPEPCEAKKIEWVDDDVWWSDTPTVIIRTETGRRLDSKHAGV